MQASENRSDVIPCPDSSDKPGLLRSGLVEEDQLSQLKRNCVGNCPSVSVTRVKIDGVWGFDPLEQWSTPSGKVPQNGAGVGFGQFTAK